MHMLGAIIGDIAGSRFEFNNIHTKDFEFFHPDCQITDDSAMTIALMAAILEGDMQNEMSFKKRLSTATRGSGRSTLREVMVWDSGNG